MRFEVPSFFTLPSSGSVTMERLIDAVFRELEAGSEVKTSIGVIVDSCSGLGSSLSSALLQELGDLVPGLPLHVAVTYTTEGDCLQGLGAYNHLLAMQTSLMYADVVLCRGRQDMLGLGSCNTMRDSTTVLACDLMMAMHPTLEWRDYRGLQRGGLLGALPPNMFTTKLLDVRSSLWKLSRCGSSSGGGSKAATGRAAAEQKYTPLRALASNLHALHVFKNPENVQKHEWVEHAYLSQCVLPREALSGSGFGFLNLPSASTRNDYTHSHQVNNNNHRRGGGVPMSEKDTCANLKWAMPCTRWNDVSGPFAPGQVLLPPCDAGQESEVHTLCFTSPHSLQHLQSCVSSVQTLLKRKAYVHRFEESGISDADLHACVENVRSAVGI